MSEKAAKHAVGIGVLIVAIALGIAFMASMCNAQTEPDTGHAAFDSIAPVKSFYAIGGSGAVTTVTIPQIMGAGCTGKVFADITEAKVGHAFCRAAELMYTLKLTSGCVADNPATQENERRYCPDDPVTRGQMAVFLRQIVLGLLDP